MIKRCTQCVLPSNYPEISFNEKGECNHCKAYSEAPEIDWKEKEKTLLDILATARARHLPYDVLVPWSGGKDSTYVLYILKEKYHLKVLAINCNNGFQSEAAQANLKNISSQLGVPLIILKPDWNLVRRIYAHYLREKGELCSACNMVGYTTIMSFAYRESLIHGHFPLIINGWAYEFENIKGVEILNYPEFINVLKNDENLIDEFESNALVDLSVCERLKQIGDLRNASVQKAGTTLSMVQLPDYIEWNPPLISETLQKNTAFHFPPDGRKSHIDCDFAPIAKYLFFKEWGFEQNTVTYSTMIRKGLMAREEALTTFERENSDKPEEMDALLERLNIPHKDIKIKSSLK